MAGTCEILRMSIRENVLRDKRAHLSSARKLAQGRTQALRKLSLGDVYFDPPHLQVLAKTSRAQARARLAQGRSARDPNWQAWNKDIEQLSYVPMNLQAPEPQTQNPKP